MSIEYSANKTANKVDFKSRHNGKDNNSGVYSSTKSVENFHKCGRKFHIKRY